MSESSVITSRYAVFSDIHLKKAGNTFEKMEIV